MKPSRASEGLASAGMYLIQKNATVSADKIAFFAVDVAVTHSKTVSEDKAIV